MLDGLTRGLKVEMPDPRRTQAPAPKGASALEKLELLRGKWIGVGLVAIRVDDLLAEIEALSSVEPAVDERERAAPARHEDMQAFAEELKREPAKRDAFFKTAGIDLILDAAKKAKGE